MNDYAKRSYLSTTEVASYLGIKVHSVHNLIKVGNLPAAKAAGGQYRVNIKDVKTIERKYKSSEKNHCGKTLNISGNGAAQKIFFENSQKMKALSDNSIHLALTSPPYFNAKMYSGKSLKNDLGNVHDIDEWLCEIAQVWKEVFRVLQPGRKFFLNIMNLPVRHDKSFRTLNLVGKSTDLCESIGFIFKRDIIWQKTNGVRAHFGTYPYPGGILINNMHESILEFEKPNYEKANKYAHLTKKIKEKSKIDKDFWLSLKNSDVWIMNPERSGDGREHIAPFPYELPYRLIKAYTYIGETVLDPFCGSATSLLAAKDLGRNGVGYEINSGFADMIRKRLNV